MPNPQEVPQVTIYADIESLQRELEQLCENVKSRKTDDQAVKDTRMVIKGR